MLGTVSSMGTTVSHAWKSRRLLPKDSLTHSFIHHLFIPCAAAFFFFLPDIVLGTEAELYKRQAKSIPSGAHGPDKEII